MIQLRGSTWDHARGYAPLPPTAAEYHKSHPDVEIRWEKRSLQDFADFPVEELAKIYDLIVLDHPSVGAAGHAQCIRPLDEFLSAENLATLAAQSVGPSHRSYTYNGHQYALGIDAAGHVSAYRDDLLQSLNLSVPKTCEEVLALGRELRHSKRATIAIPLIPVDSFMLFYTLCASSGEDPFSRDCDSVISRETGLQALDFMTQVLAVCHPESLNWNPIKVLDAMSSTSNVAYCPWTFGYSNYSRPGYAPFACKFTNIPPYKPGTPKGAILGGAGLSITSACRNPEAAAHYAMYVASAECQRTTYFQSGGQPGNLVAWQDSEVNQACNNFFRNTLDTLTLSYLRPRYAGYIHFQTQAGLAVHDFLKNHGNPLQVLETLDELYRTTRDSASSPEWMEL